MSEKLRESAELFLASLTDERTKKVAAISEVLSDLRRRRDDISAAIEVLGELYPETNGTVVDLTNAPMLRKALGEPA